MLAASNNPGEFEQYLDHICTIHLINDLTIMSMALTKTVSSGHNFVACLLDRNFNFYAVDKYGNTLLHTLANNMREYMGDNYDPESLYYNSVALEHSLKAMRSLINGLGLDYNARNVFGETMAEASGYVPLIDYVDKLNQRRSLGLIDISRIGIPAEHRRELRDFLM
jgi:hypothetical protein